MRPAEFVKEKTFNAKKRILLVEDQEELSSEWVQIIEAFKDFECIETCATGEEAIERVPQIHPDVILMDIRLPQMSGIECTSRLKALLPAVLIVILTVLDDDRLIFRALEAGADGYLLKRSKPADLRAALLDVIDGGAPMSSAIARRVVHFFQRSSTRVANTQLSARETEILKLLTKGFSNKEIADQVELSIETVRVHLKNIYRKLHVRCRTEAAVQYGVEYPSISQKISFEK